MHVAKWRSLKDSTQPLPTGAFVAAAEWWKFGRLVLERGTKNGHPVVNADALARCFRGSAVNPRYGLTWWLSPLPAIPDIVYASGAGGQALYVIPGENLVVVKIGQSASYRHDVGTVDKFQGREAYVVFFSTAASSPDDAPRGIDFIFDRQRFNVAISRARALAVMVGSPGLLPQRCTSVESVLVANGVWRFIETARK